MKRPLRALLTCVVLLHAAHARASEAPSWRVERGDVQIVVPLRPGGAFTATTPSVSGLLALAPGTPARLTGELAMDLSTIDTGIALRNQHLREKYLEVSRGKGFDQAVLSGIQLDDATGAAFEGRTRWTGNLLLHGVTQRVMGTADIRPEGAGRRVRSEFTVTLTDFAITPPEYLGVGVGAKLLVKVQLTAVPVPPSR